MITVWKSTIHPGVATIRLPLGSRMLSCAAEGDNLILWSQVETTYDQVYYDVAVLMTGCAPPPGVDMATARFIGSAQIGWCVLHVYDLGRTP